MAQPQYSSGIVAGIITILGLGLIWVIVVANFPSQEELSVAAEPTEIRAAVRPSGPVPAPPELDLTIPTSPPYPSEQARSRSDDERSFDSRGDASAGAPLNPRAVEVAKLRCDAEIERLCPDSPDGSGPTRCLERRAKQLSRPCYSQVRERFVKWKVDRHRMMASCDEDVARFCSGIEPGGGQILQCLQSHSPEVSDRCYETLPKGAVYFK